MRLQLLQSSRTPSRDSSRTPSRTALLPAKHTSLVALFTLFVVPATAFAQEATPVIPLDRWLVSERLDPLGLGSDRPADPLTAPEGALFPDRDLEVGPTYWILVRDDGVRGLEARTALAALDARRAFIDEVPDDEGPGDEALRDEALGGEAAVGGETAVGEANRDAAIGADGDSVSSMLAHVYIKAPEDRTVRLDVGHRDCQALRVWLNGQHIEHPTATVQLRLAGGWNTLLVHMRESAECAPGFEAALLPGIDIDEDSGASGTLRGIRVQASRPPGVRRQYPDGWVSVGALEVPQDLDWQAGAEDLTGAVRYQYAAWGRSDTPIAGGDDAARPTEPPTYDVTGEWDLDIYGPMGLERTVAEFRMAADGTLNGRITEAERQQEFEAAQRLGFRGEIEDGWVSGDRISFGLRISTTRGQSVEVRLEGLIEENFIRGTLVFQPSGRRTAPVGDFESRFEANRRGEGGDQQPGEEETEGEERPEPGERPQLPRPARGERPDGRAGGLPGTGGQPSDEQLRARIRRQLLPPPEPTAPAPDSAAFELRLDGPRIIQMATDLRPASVRSDASRLTFERLRELALSRDGAEMRVRWADADRELRRSVPPEGVLRALHGAITLTGWTEVSEGQYTGTWRVPDALSGFTLRVVSPEDALASDRPGGVALRVSGRALTPDRADLCSPCRSGERLEILLTGTAPGAFSGRTVVSDAGDAGDAGGSGGDLQVRIVEPGYPDAAPQAASGEAPPGPAEWLRALRGDNRRYRELAARYAGGTGD